MKIGYTQQSNLLNIRNDVIKIMTEKLKRFVKNQYNLPFCIYVKKIRKSEAHEGI